MWQTLLFYNLQEHLQLEMQSWLVATEISVTVCETVELRSLKSEFTVHT